MQHRIRVWDLPTRVFHWALALAVIALIVTGKVGGEATFWHARLGHVVLALLVFRLVWGLVGGRWSRFAAFLYAPGTVVRYLKGDSRPEHTIGHNPLGAGSVFAVLTILAVQVATGLMSDDEIAFAGPLAKFVPGSVVSQATTWHRSWGQWLLIALVVLHVAAILYYLWKKRENLIAPMLHGDKLSAHPLPPSRDDVATRVAALVLLPIGAALAVWVYRLG